MFCLLHLNANEIPNIIKINYYLKINKNQIIKFKFNVFFFKVFLETTQTKVQCIM